MSSSFILLRAIPSMSSANLADKINFLQTWILSISNIRQTVLVQPFLQLDKLQVTEIWSRISTLELVQHHHLRDAFKKKNFIWREKFLTCFTPSPPLQK